MTKKIAGRKKSSGENWHDQVSFGFLNKKTQWKNVDWFKNFGENTNVQAVENIRYLAKWKNCGENTGGKYSIVG